MAFEEARARMGMETQRQWSAPAIARTTPAILALYSILTLAAKYLLEQQPMVIRHAAWYAKDRATFSDTIALVRRSIWGAQIYDGSGDQHNMVKIPRSLLDRLTETVSYAV